MRINMVHYRGPRPKLIDVIWRFLIRRWYFNNNIVHFSTQPPFCAENDNTRRRIKEMSQSTRWVSQSRSPKFSWDKSKSHWEISESPQTKGEMDNRSSSSSPSPPMSYGEVKLLYRDQPSSPIHWNLTSLLPDVQAICCYKAVVCPQTVKMQTRAKDQDSLQERRAKKVLVAGEVTVIVAPIHIFYENGRGKSTTFNL